MNITKDKFFKEAVDLINNNKIDIYCNLPTDVVNEYLVGGSKSLCKVIKAAANKAYINVTHQLMYDEES